MNEKETATLSEVKPMWCCRNIPETWRSSVALIAALLFVLPVPAQDAPPKESEPGAKPPEPKTVAEVLKDSDRIDGLFTLYRDRKTGALRMALTADELEKTYLYFTYTENGVPAAGLFRGAFGMSRADVFRVSRYYDRIEFIVENTSYYFDESKAIARAADANVSHAVAATEKIEAEDTAQGLVVINASNLFLTEAFHRVTPLPDPNKKPHEVFSLGKLNAAKSRISEVRNYPSNTDVIVEYVYDNEQPYVAGGDEVTDPRFVSITVQHSLLAAPDDRFAPRFDDPRVGYFTDEVTDLSSTEIAPYRDVIHRWKLVKKDPSRRRLGTRRAHRLLDREHDADGAAAHHRGCGVALERSVRERRLSQRRRGADAARRRGLGRGRPALQRDPLGLVTEPTVRRLRPELLRSAHGPDSRR